MTDFLKAADDAKLLLRGFVSVQTLADAFEQVGSLQQAQAEAEAALVALKPKVADAKGKVAQAEETLRSAELEAKQKLADADVQAFAILSAAQAKVDEIKASADAYYENSKAGTDELVASANASVDESIAKRDAVLAEVDALELRVADAKAYLARLQA
jgi:chromosome segregation ATPase